MKHIFIGFLAELDNSKKILVLPFFCQLVGRASKIVRLTASQYYSGPWSYFTFNTIKLFVTLCVLIGIICFQFMVVLRKLGDGPYLCPYCFQFMV